MAMHRFIMAVVFLVLTATVASAYTIVMRNGRRVEIPNEFTITASTLTYTVGSGIQITIQLSGVDIAATERANREPQGGFLARGSAPGQVVAQPTQAQPRAQRSITNRDLEGYRRARIESELAYEKRRKELGLPSSADERRREFAAITERTREQLLSKRADEQSAEEYWRGRANSLRSEMAVAQAQIDYVRRRLDEMPSSPFTIIDAPGIVNFPLQNPFFNGRGSRQDRFNRFRNRRGRLNNIFGGNVFALPNEFDDRSYERAELINQLDQLQINHAGLNVRWRELEEEARRAGAYPGWLRP